MGEIDRRLLRCVSSKPIVRTSAPTRTMARRLPSCKNILCSSLRRHFTSPLSPGVFEDRVLQATGERHLLRRSSFACARACGSKVGVLRSVNLLPPRWGWIIAESIVSSTTRVLHSQPQKSVFPMRMSCQGTQSFALLRPAQATPAREDRACRGPRPSHALTLILSGRTYF